MISDALIIDSYDRHKHLFTAANELGMKWQTLYWRLKKLGIQVCGDKSKYGSHKDKFAHKGEEEFQRLVPFAENQNKTLFQPKIDFVVNGVTVDVKSAKVCSSSGKYKSLRWAFSLKKQILIAEYFVLLGFDGEGAQLQKAFLIPGDMINAMQTISIATNGNSKWYDFEVDPNDLAEFFSG